MNTKHMTLAAKIKFSLGSPLLLSAALITGCKSTPNKNSAQEPQIQYNHAELIEKSQASESPQKELYLLGAANSLSEQGEYDWARNLLSAIEPEQLNDSAFGQYSLVYSRLALLNDEYFLARRILTEPRLERQWRQLNPAQTLELRERRAQVFIILGDINASVHERMKLGALLQDQDALSSNLNAIWQALMTLSAESLRTNVTSESNQELKAWYELASLNKNNQGDLGLQQKKIEQWQRKWPQHPASLMLPTDLELIKELIQNNPQQVALLLPLSGKLSKAGTAIRDGFFSAYYQAVNEGAWTPTIKVYDTANGSDINTRYTEAYNNGAQMVIGPLNKNSVATLAGRHALPVPVLSLNYAEAKADAAAETQPAHHSNLNTHSSEQPIATTDLAVPTQPLNTDPNTPSTDSAKLYQFGLAIEDEAIQTANRAWLEGHRRAMIIAPDAGWGARSADAFSRKWLALGGDITDTARFKGNNDYSKIISSALHIDDSKQRARELRTLFGHNFEFEPRRREDLDMIFLTARPSQARQVMPTLAFHYAGKVPVFATSHAYSGKTNSKTDRDLNNLKFSSSPWTFDNNRAEKQQIDRFRPSNASYGRLYALGVDAYHLYPRLTQLEQASGTRFYGATGALKMQQDRRIRREQTWAQIRRGKATPLPTIIPTVTD